jgi:drug/metabolite transporter (DMT)-like permease
LPTRTSTLAGLAAIVLWSATVPLARGLSEHVGPVTGAAAVYGVSGALALISRLRGGAGRSPRKYVATCGALFVVYAVLLYVAIGRAVDRRQVLGIGLVNYLWPALTLVFSTVLLGRRARWYLWPATALAVAGVALALTHATAISWPAFAGDLAGNPAAYAMALAAAVCWALYSNLTQRWATGSESGAVDLFLILTAITFAALTALGDEHAQWSRAAVGEAVFLGLATFGGYRLWDRAMRRGDAGLVAAASYLTPLLSTLAGCLYLGVAPGSRLWIGCVALIAGSVLSWRALAAGRPATEQGGHSPETC